MTLEEIFFGSLSISAHRNRAGNARKPVREKKPVASRATTTQKSPPALSPATASGEEPPPRANPTGKHPLIFLPVSQSGQQRPCPSVREPSAYVLAQVLVFRFHRPVMVLVRSHSFWRDFLSVPFCYLVLGVSG
jgi:hypothetical protein